MSERQVTKGILLALPVVMGTLAPILTGLPLWAIPIMILGACSWGWLVLGWLWL